MTYIAYLDEFGHVGPYIARNDPRHNDSPVFGLAGFVMPVDEVRGFGTWVFQRKCELLDFEVRRSGEHPALWEKKGSSLCTVRNVERYPELRKMTNRLLNKIGAVGGRVFYVGIRKTAEPEARDANAMYSNVLAEAIRRLDAFCREDHPSPPVPACTGRAPFARGTAHGCCPRHVRRGRAAAPVDRTAVPVGEPPVSNAAGRRLDRRSCGSTGGDLEGTGGLAGKHRLPPVFRAQVNPHPDTKRSS